MSHRSAYRIVLHKPPGEFWSQPFGLDLGPCLRERSPITDAAYTERVVPSVSPFVNWHCHCPFPRCSHGRRQFTTRSEIRLFVFAATCWTREKPTHAVQIETSHSESDR